MDAKERTALIIGTSRGLGLRLVRQHRERGFRVVATVRDARAVPEAFRGDDGIEIEQLDVTHQAEIDALAQRLAGRRFDLLFVNAGVANPRPAETPIGDISTDEFVRLMVTNALGPIRCLEACAPLVRERGTMAVMSSGLGSVANNTRGGWEAYRASKAALNTLLRSFAVRHEGRGQTILAVSPGWSKTEMGGLDAPLAPDESVRGVMNTLAAFEGTGEHAFVDYRGERVPW
jgi:NAD(P)-dependent dehydrogenase (short-subunit alcohol dehydrogenase family)